MGSFKDLTNLRFGRLTVLYCVSRSTRSNPVTKWMCRCDCGSETKVRSYHLQNGLVQSCRCLFKEKLSERKAKHRLTKTRIYRIWQNMITRTTNEKAPSYKNYGARGISVCEGWMGFENFQKDMHASYLEHVEVHGERDTTLERINNEEGYSPMNCRWATLAEQGSNKRSNKRYDVDGEMLTLSEISRRYNIPRETVFYRLKRKWPMSRVIEPAEKVSDDK